MWCLQFNVASIMFNCAYRCLIASTSIGATKSGGTSTLLRRIPGDALTAVEEAVRLCPEGSDLPEIANALKPPVPTVVKLITGFPWLCLATGVVGGSGVVECDWANRELGV